LGHPVHPALRERMAELRDSTIEKLHIKGRTALLRTF
jgi:hypothetical protein